jgi:hypothetical protein
MTLFGSGVTVASINLPDLHPLKPLVPSTIAPFITPSAITGHYPIDSNVMVLDYGIHHFYRYRLLQIFEYGELDRPIAMNRAKKH